MNYLKLVFVLAALIAVLFTSCTKEDVTEELEMTAVEQSEASKAANMTAMVPFFTKPEIDCWDNLVADCCWSGTRFRISTDSYNHWIDKGYLFEWTFSEGGNTSTQISGDQHIVKVWSSVSGDYSVRVCAFKPGLTGKVCSDYVNEYHECSSCTSPCTPC